MRCRYAECIKQTVKLIYKLSTEYRRGISVKCLFQAKSNTGNGFETVMSSFAEVLSCFFGRVVNFYAA